MRKTLTPAGKETGTGDGTPAALGDPRLRQTSDDHKVVPENHQPTRGEQQPEETTERVKIARACFLV